MALLKLKADPTFKQKVAIPVAGKEPVLIEFEFKHRTRDELAKFVDTGTERTDVDSVLEMIVGWEFTDKLNRDNVERLVQNYAGSVSAIAQAYYRELIGRRLGN